MASSCRFLLLDISEIWIKGKNRKNYLSALRYNVLNALQSTHDEKINYVQEGPKIFVTSKTPFSDQTISLATKIAGVESIHLCSESGRDIEEIKDIALKEVRDLQPSPRSLRVETKRADKNYPLSSMEISKQVGGHLIYHLNNPSDDREGCNKVEALSTSELEAHDIKPKIKVDMKTPDVTIRIRLLRESTFIAVTKLKGPGGLPVGTSGNGLTLLSGGFDSPVASVMMSARGLKQDFVFFHAHPFVGDEVLEKIKRLAQILATYQQKRCRLHVIPFGEIQTRISKECQENYRTLLFRKYMMQTSEILAEKIKATVLVTGDALSQVSSQTIKNISLIDQSVKLPIFRPLIGMNKFDIISRAKQFGTHDVSVKPHDDACALLAPKSPVTGGNQKYWDHFEQNHDYREDLIKANDNAKIFILEANGEIRQKDEPKLLF